MFYSYIKHKNDGVSSFHLLLRLCSMQSNFDRHQVVNVGRLSAAVSEKPLRRKNLASVILPSVFFSLFSTRR